MELEDLIGTHTLLGVDFYNENVRQEDAQFCLFELDSGTYHTLSTKIPTMATGAI